MHKLSSSKWQHKRHQHTRTIFTKMFHWREKHTKPFTHSLKISFSIVWYSLDGCFFNSMIHHFNSKHLLTIAAIPTAICPDEPTTECVSSLNGRCKTKYGTIYNYCLTDEPKMTSESVVRRIQSKKKKMKLSIGLHPKRKERKKTKQHCGGTPAFFSFVFFD